MDKNPNRITDIAYLLNLHRKSKGITLDSRPKINGKNGDSPKDKMFFALKGTHVDGNDFAIDALKAGAIAAVIDNPKILEAAQKSPSIKKFASRLCLVEDVLKSLQDMGHLHRTEFNIPVIGITGTNGKTTTKELLAAALSKKFGVVATVGNLNTEMGVPMTLLRITDKTGIAVIEMGAKKKGDIRALCEIADPTHGLVTNMGIAHIEGFGSKENIIKTKSELYEYVNEHGGTIFINKKDEILKKSLQRIIGKKTKGKSAKIIEYGEKDLVSEKVRNKNLIGGYNLINMNAAKAIAQKFRVSSKKIDEAIREYLPANMRSQHVISKKTGNSILLDAYNANPSSMPLAIEAYLEDVRVNSLKISTPFLLLGEMRELGKESAKEHAKIIKIAEGLVKNKKAEVVLLGDEFFKLKTKNASVHVFKTKENFLKSSVYADLAKMKRKADIFIKGSRGLKLEELVSHL